VAVHALSAVKGAHTTVAEHMPASHRAHLEWTPAKLIAWGERIGAATAAVVRWQMEHRPHPEQGYRACLGLQRWRARAATSGWKRHVPGRCRSARPPTAASTRSSPPGSIGRRCRRRRRAPCRCTTTCAALTTTTDRRRSSCSTNTPWTNCAACASTAWSTPWPTRRRAPRPASWPSTIGWRCWCSARSTGATPSG